MRVEAVAAARAVEVVLEALLRGELGHLHVAGLGLLDAHAVLGGQVLGGRCARAPRARRGRARSCATTTSTSPGSNCAERGLEAALADVAPGTNDVRPDLDSERRHRSHARKPASSASGTAARAAATASWSARSLSALCACSSPVSCPRTQCQRTSSCRAISASSARTRSWFLTGSPPAVFQPRALPAGDPLGHRVEHQLRVGDDAGAAAGGQRAQALERRRVLHAVVGRVRLAAGQLDRSPLRRARRSPPSRRGRGCRCRRRRSRRGPRRPASTGFSIARRW